MANIEKDELQKYEAELDAVNKNLAELDDQRNKIIRHGMRIEGIVVFLRGKLNENPVPQEEKKEEAAA